MDNAKHMIVKHFNIAQESPRKYEVIRSNDDGEYFRFVGKSCSPIFKVRVLIWEDNKLTFQFCSNHAEETKIYLAVKK